MTVADRASSASRELAQKKHVSEYCTRRGVLASAGAVLTALPLAAAAHASAPGGGTEGEKVEITPRDAKPEAPTPLAALLAIVEPGDGRAPISAAATLSLVYAAIHLPDYPGDAAALLALSRKAEALAIEGNGGWPRLCLYQRALDRMMIDNGLAAEGFAS